MIRFTRRQLAATMVLAAAAGMTLSLAGEAPAPEAPRAYVIPKKGVSDAIRKAVESPNRPKADVARDADRKPAEVMALAGIKPGQKVLEFGSMGQYYTTMLSEVVGPKGMIYMYDPLDTEQYYGKASRDFVAKHPNTQYEAVDFNKIQLPRNIDVVFTVLYYHEILMRGIDMTPFHDKIFKALKPGGTYLIVDHAAEIGVDMKDSLKFHRLDPSVIRSTVQADGFELVIDSRMLENLDDDHKWIVGTPGKRDKTDQTVYMFRKPLIY
jgi:predicted methyltransferase